MKTFLLVSTFLATIVLTNEIDLFAQQHKGQLIAGPMQGHTTVNQTTIWLLTKNASKCSYQWTKNNKIIQSGAHDLTHSLSTIRVDGYQTVILELNRATHEVEKESIYALNISLDGKEVIKGHPIKFVPMNGGQPNNFSFLFGSCNMDIPLGKVFFPKHKWSLFSRMAETQQDASFMLWLGDHVYFRRKHFASKKGMYRRYVKTRSNKHLNRLIKAMPHYATWDDHDYGPDNSDETYAFKDSALQVFQQFWANPTYGSKDSSDTKGVFTSFSRQDVDFFLLDSRYAKQKGKQLLGRKQLDWLKSQLSASKANFKFITLGSQFISHVPESLKSDAAEEYWELIHFIKTQKISGIVFLSGDRHFGDLHQVHYKGLYPLYDFTSSPLTSPSRTFLSKFENNVDTRIVEWAGEPNFGKVTIEGVGEQRACLLALYNRKMEVIWSHRILLKELQFK